MEDDILPILGYFGQNNGDSSDSGEKFIVDWLRLLNAFVLMMLHCCHVVVYQLECVVCMYCVQSVLVFLVNLNLVHHVYMYIN